MWLFPSHLIGDTDMTGFDRVTRDPAVMGGKACIRGMRVTVGMIVNQIGEGDRKSVG